MIEARVLIKHSPSKCNKELLDFLHRNIKSIKKKINIKVIIVYDDLISKLPKNIKRLPVMILHGVAVTGNADIRQRIIAMLGTTQVKSKQPIRDMGASDLEDFWNGEMHNGTDNEHPDDTLMETVKNKALDVSMKRQETTPKLKKRSNPIISSSRNDNIQLEQIKGNKISDLVDNDPMMQKFWANQESTPGFEGTAENTSVDF